MKGLFILLIIIGSATQAVSQIVSGVSMTPQYIDRYRNVGVQNNGQGMYEILQFMRMTSSAPVNYKDNSCKVIRKGGFYIKIQIACRAQDTAYQFKFRNAKYGWEDDRMIVFTKANIKDLGKNLRLFRESNFGQCLSTQYYGLRNENEDNFSGIALYVEDGYCLLSYREIKKIIKVIDNL